MSEGCECSGLLRIGLDLKVQFWSCGSAGPFTMSAPSLLPPRFWGWRSGFGYDEVMLATSSVNLIDNLEEMINGKFLTSLI